MLKNIDPLAPGNYYHIYNRACGFEKLFFEKSNYNFFMENFHERLDESLEILSYCLLPNHFHFLVKMKENSLFDDYHKQTSKLFSNFFCSYTRSFNKFYSRTGNLFSSSFRRILIEDYRYLQTVSVYINRNPVKHNIVQDLDDWKHSSFHEIINKKPVYCNFEEILDWFGSIQTFKFCCGLNTEVNLEDS